MSKASGRRQLTQGVTAEPIACNRTLSSEPHNTGRSLDLLCSQDWYALVT